MGNCEIALEQISASLDGTLTTEEQAALDVHLAECAACTALYTELHSLHTAAVGLETLTAPAGFTDAVMAAVAAESMPSNVIPFAAKRKTRTPWSRWAAPAAAVAIVVLGAVSSPSLSGSMEGMRNSAAQAAPMAPQAYQDECSIADADSDGYYGVDTTTGTNDIGTVIFETPETTEDSSDNCPNEPCAPSAPESAPLGDAATRCGTLTLPADLAPEGLEQHIGTICFDGTVTYTVPADYFFLVLQTLERSTRTDYQFIGGDIGAQQGVIIISVNP